MTRSITKENHLSGKVYFKSYGLNLFPKTWKLNNKFVLIKGLWYRILQWYVKSFDKTVQSEKSTRAGLSYRLSKIKFNDRRSLAKKQNRYCKVLLIKVMTKTSSIIIFWFCRIGKSLYFLDRDALSNWKGRINKMEISSWSGLKLQTDRNLKLFRQPKNFEVLGKSAWWSSTLEKESFVTSEAVAACNNST